MNLLFVKIETRQFDSTYSFWENMRLIIWISDNKDSKYWILFQNFVWVERSVFISFALKNTLRNGQHEYSLWNEQMHRKSKHKYNLISVTHIWRLLPVHSQEDFGHTRCHTHGLGHHAQLLYLLTYHHIWFWPIRMIVVIWRQNRWTRTSSLKDAGPCRQSIVHIGSEWSSRRISTALKSNFYKLCLSCLWCDTVGGQFFFLFLSIFSTKIK